MHPRVCILLLIVFSCFLHFTRALDSRAAQDEIRHPEMPLGSDTHDQWTGFVSLLNLVNIAGKIKEPSFISNLGTPFTADSDKVQPEASSSPEGGPELLRPNLEAFLSEEAGNIIRSFENVINSAMALGVAFHDVLESASSDRAPPSIAPFVPLLQKVANLVAIACDDVRGKFPLPATAPGHEERAKRVSETLEHLQPLLIHLAREYEIEQVVTERHLARVKPFFQDVGVLIGDVAELYPAAIEALVLNISAALLPEAIFLRSLVILYCFGPYVLGKDAISGWLL